MNAAFASGLVRGWVALYTRGLPGEVRTARSDEIESDLWSQQEEAGSTKRPDSALAGEIVARLLLGMAADIAWRLERRRLADRSMERSTTMGTRIVALLAVAGGLGLGLVVAGWAETSLNNPGAHPWAEPGGSTMAAVGIAAIFALCLSLGGLGFILGSRFDSPVGVVAIMGAAGGVLGVLGGYAALVMLPVASVVVVLYLARLHAVHWSLALVHAASAPGIVLGLAAYYNTGLVGISTALIVAYCLTWIGIGLELLGGIPQGRPATRRAS